MITTINCFDFVRAFEEAGRQDQFTHAGLLALFEYLEELEEDCGEPIELDVVALCCDFSEYDTALEALADHGSLLELDLEDYDEDEDETVALEWLEQRTSVISSKGGLIIQSF